MLKRLTNLAENKLEPKQQTSKDEAVPLNTGQAELGEVETCEIERAAADEQIVSLCAVDVTTAVKAAERHSV